MEANQFALLSTLAKEIKAQKRDGAKVIATLKSAKILTKSGKFTSHYPNLNKAVVVSK